MKRKTLVMGIILAVSLAAACGSKAPVPIEAPASNTEASASEGSETSESKKVIAGAEQTEGNGNSNTIVKKTPQEPLTAPDAKNEYDSDGRIVKSEVEGQGYDTFAYDEAGNLSEQKCYDEAGELITTITNEYDSNGNVIKSQDVNSDGSEGCVLTYKYDNNGYLIEIYSDYGNGDYEKDLYKRDAAGRELEYTFISGTKDGETEVQKLESEYDDHGNVIHETFYSMGKKMGENKYVYTYDNAGNITNKETYSNDGLTEEEPVEP
ncbi:MAG: hypothetical protein J5487_00245 [Lachnospiraceae bacterium]|nr:hypothetical protein [Lachnospiraceae bacterium]